MTKAASEPARDHEHDPDKIDQEILADTQGARPPFGSDVMPPFPIERHGRHWTQHDPRVERNDTDRDLDDPHMH